MTKLLALTLTHEDTERIVAEHGSPCCDNTTSTTWWIYTTPDGTDVLCERCALLKEVLIEIAAAAGEDTTGYGLIRIPTAAQRADRAAADAADIGIN